MASIAVMILGPLFSLFIRLDPSLDKDPPRPQARSTEALEGARS
jgi:hypothetical protein